MTPSSMKVKIKRIDKTLPLPEYQTAGSVGFDLYSRIDATFAAAEIKDLPSNLIIEVPEGHFLMVTARSSLPKKGLALANSVGVVDQDFHGPEDELHLRLINFTNSPVSVKRGERLAQGLILPIERAEWVEGDELGKNSRGGFGSTG